MMVLRRSIAIFATATAAAGALHFQFACAGTKRERVEHPTAVEGPQRPDAIPSRAKNAILFVGDGMGISTVTAARILEGQLRGESGEENQLSFDRFPDVALIKVYNTNQQTPDSAGTMTAIVTGEKTRAGVVSVDASVERGDFSRANAHRLETIVEIAEDRGRSTGLVTTTSVTHATPAALYAHSPERNWDSDTTMTPEARAADFPDIARQLIEFSHGDGLEVALGGGEQYFRPDGPTTAALWPQLKGSSHHEKRRSRPHRRVAGSSSRDRFSCEPARESRTSTPPRLRICSVSSPSNTCASKPTAKTLSRANPH